MAKIFKLVPLDSDELSFESNETHVPTHSRTVTNRESDSELGADNKSPTNSQGALSSTCVPDQVAKCSPGKVSFNESDWVTFEDIFQVTNGRGSKIRIKSVHKRKAKREL